MATVRLRYDQEATVVKPDAEVSSKTMVILHQMTFHHYPTCVAIIS